jgi:hypothetical protein
MSALLTEMKTLSSPRRSYIPPGPKSHYRKLPVFGSALDSVVSWFQHQGYAEWTILNHLKSVSRLIRWLQQRHGRDLKGLTQADLGPAYDWFRKRDSKVAGTIRVFGRFFRECQLLIPEGRRIQPSATKRELESHCAYLRDNCGLAVSTVKRHQSIWDFFCDS